MFFFLAYFTLYNRLQFHPSHQNWFKWILFHGWVILHCVYVPQLSYPFICWWTSGLFPCPGYYKQCCDNSIQFSHSVVSDSLWSHGLQHSRLPCPSPTPGDSSNSCLSSQWCHPTISSSVIPFSSCSPSFPASGSFPMNWLFVTGGQRTGASASASVFPMNIQGWFPLGMTSLII